jgi:hypothetical protein
VEAMPRSYQVTPAGPSHQVPAKPMNANPFRGGRHPQSQTPSDQEPNHRNSGAVTLTLTDTLVERVTGQARAADIDVELQLMMPLDTLIDPRKPSTAVIPGYGPLPTELAREILMTSGGRKWWRRPFSSPRDGPIVGGDPNRRHFDGWLAQLIKLRDQTCRDPFCDAPIRHIDHIIRHADGGLTSYINGRGTCARGNYVREMPRWHIRLVDCGFDCEPHKIIITTPTGHDYLSRAPDPP